MTIGEQSIGAVVLLVAGVVLSWLRQRPVKAARKRADGAATAAQAGEQAAIISMLFNLGLAGFLGFRNMVQALREGRWEIAADDSLDSERARQLPNRAAEEAKLILTGEWS
ncbi:MAG: glycoside hydrolase family protein [Armatimonadia bacterium]